MVKKSSKKYCPHCGHPVDADAKFCTHCGYKFSNNNLDTHKNIPSRVQRNKAIPSVKQWLKSDKHKWGVGIVAVVIFLCLGTGVYHHQHMATQQQQATQQQPNQNQNNQNNKPKPVPKSKQSEQATGNYLNDLGGFTTNEDKTEEQDPHNYHKFTMRSNIHNISQYYYHGTDNPYFKQMLKWCRNQYKAHTPVSMIGRDYHFHHLTGNKYLETYRVYYDFSHHYKATNTQDNENDADKDRTHDTYQTVVWHTVVKRVWSKGSYHWLITKSTSSKNVTRPSNKTLIKVGLRNPGQSDNS